MDGNGHMLSIGALTSNISNNNLNLMFPGIPIADDTEADVLNDETFGDCDLETIKIKSDFGENGEFLGENSSGGLPDFFDSDQPDTDEGLSLMNNDDQSQSIDALLGEDPMRISIRQSATNPLFNMAISQARDTNIFTQQQQQQQQIPRRPSPLPQQQQINYQLLKQFEQSLINRQIPPQERMILMQAMFEKMQRDSVNIQQQTARMTNLNLNGHNIYNQQPQRQPTQQMAIGEMMERARLTAMNTNNSRSQSPSVGISSQFMDAIQRSDQIPNRPSPPPPPVDTNVPHHGQSRQNRPARHYPRPPLLNTWQGRGPGHDEFAGLMSDREKQWVVKIQLHQVCQTQEEDYYFHKWSQQKHHGNQLNRHDYRGQKISYPVLQLLKSIQQEKELAERLSQSSGQATFSNVIPYASPIHTQLGKQSTATPRHPRCTLHLDGQFSLGTQANAITHNKYNLGLLLHIENLRRDILQFDNNEDLPTGFNSIIDRYLNDQKYFFPDLFGQFSKGRIIYERLHRYLIISTKGHLELMLIRLYGSLSYMIQRWPTTFHIEPIVMNTISLMQQQVNVKKTTFEQLLGQVYAYYNEQIKPRLVQIDSSRYFESPFSNPLLFTNSHIVTILIELLLILERQCYLLSGANTSTLPIQIMQQLQPQLQYQLSEHVRLFINDLCQALIACSSSKKILKPFAQIHQQQFALLCKFIRLQISPQIYAALEPNDLQSIKNHSPIEQLSNSYSPLQLILITALVTVLGLSIYRFLFEHDEDILIRIREMVFRLARRLPVVQRKIAQAREDTLKSVCEDIAKSVAGHQFTRILPEKGLSKDELLKQLENYRNLERINYKSGQVSGCVYKLAKSDMTEIYNKVFSLFGETNPLHVDVFPDIRKMEVEVVRCACKTYRDLAYSKGITKPEM